MSCGRRPEGRSDSELVEHVLQCEQEQRGEQVKEERGSQNSAWLGHQSIGRPPCLGAARFRGHST